MRRKQRFIIFNIVAFGLLTIVGGILESLASSFIPKDYFPYVWPALGVVALASIGFSVWLYRLQEGNEQLPQSVQNRQRLIEKVRATWIKGVLEKSLYNEVFITLGLREQADAVSNPWHLIMQKQNRSSYTLPADTHISKVYDDAGGELLILGKAGFGKTTLLLELARDLLDRAQKDDKLRIPVVFNLSSWAVKRQILADWLVEELNVKYQVPRKLGQSWVDGDQIQPLLDGLDEVKPEYREECVKAINIFRKYHGIVPTVVCSRTTEYLKRKNRIMLRTAVVVQPLTEPQIDNYLSSAGSQLATIRAALRKDAVLKQLATTPLMLSVLTLAYHGIPIEEILKGKSETSRRQVFEKYIQRMLQHRGTDPRYTTHQTISWLTWLARQMAQHDQTEFYIERMQPDLLPDKRSRAVYRVVVGLAYGLMGALSFGMIAKTELGWLVGLTIGLLTGLAFWLISGWIIRNEEIEPVEIVTLSLQRLPKAMLIGLITGMLFGLISALNYGLFAGLSIALTYAPFMSLVVWLISMPKHFMLDTHKLVTPNQGIWSSARNGLRTGMIVGLLTSLISVPIYGLFDGLIFVLIFGIFSWLISGGTAFIQHFTLRFILWRAGSLPWNYPRFLDYATDRLLLRKVGGGYIFVHQLLREYFASLDTTSTATTSE